VIRDFSAVGEIVQKQEEREQAPTGRSLARRPKATAAVKMQLGNIAFHIDR
jgi:hypothetical protein